MKTCDTAKALDFASLSGENVRKSNFFRNQVQITFFFHFFHYSFATHSTAEGR
jgi:hypothetical protein